MHIHFATAAAGPSSTRQCLATTRPLPPLGCVGSPPCSSRGLPSLLLPGHWQSSVFPVCPPRAAPDPAQFPLGQLPGLFYLRRESQVALHFLTAFAAQCRGPPTIEERARTRFGCARAHSWPLLPVAAARCNIKSLITSANSDQ